LYHSIPRCSALTDTGLRRSNNEDAYFADPELGLFLVADGMGGKNAGEVAAAIVVDRLPALLRQRLSEAHQPDADGVAEILFDSVMEVSRSMLDTARSKPAYAGFGATLVLVYLHEDAAWIANMGDSRAYVWRGRQMQRLTHDHNVAAALLERGDISPEEYARHPARNVLSRHMGIKTSARPDIRRLRLARHDRVLLCSDGLTSMVTDDAVLGILNSPMQLERATQSLVDAAKAGGGRDNITVVLVEF
jgi:protein phosphatase